ncbi:hypothetical protein [Leptospira sp. GIMC2001]|uniref:hypothetical protein n=1 Tax=Leptospira sp. GIMC2001 TaxID=1513297 RepID=UPI00234950E3|nr:hypothetical protein [Leptospira sp. GIMC2001]WCL50099.1 hypothetical protein O4O04_04580 [Leptospira sp. GIMC2001]
MKISKFFTLFSFQKKIYQINSHILKVASILVFCLVLFFFNLSIHSTEKCDASLEKNNLKISTYSHRKLGCALVIEHSFEFYRKNETRTRTATIFNNGMIHFFVGTSDHKKLSKSTGAKTVHLIPFSETLIDLSSSNDEEISMKSPSGLNLKANFESGLISEIEGYEISFEPLTHIDTLAKINGGINIKPKPGNILIDYGFRLGEQPISQMNRNAAIYDGYGNSCAIKVKDVFKPDPKDRDEVILLYSNTEEMLKFINKKCPKIKL